MTTPIGRSSRTACWAAAIEVGRPMAIGATIPGNSTMLRTGRMISASSGRCVSGEGCEACGSVAASLSVSVMSAAPYADLARWMTRQPLPAARVTV